MPLHTTGLTSRHDLDHPDEKPPAKADPLPYERVLKFNPNHGPDGRFTSGGGGRRGGTEGPPRVGAFGQKLSPAEVEFRVSRPKTYQDRLKGSAARAANDARLDRQQAEVARQQQESLAEATRIISGVTYASAGRQASARQMLSNASLATRATTTTHTGSMVGGVPTKRSTFS